MTWAGGERKKGKAGPQHPGAGLPAAASSSTRRQRRARLSPAHRHGHAVVDDLAVHIDDVAGLCGCLAAQAAGAACVW